MSASTYKRRPSFGLNLLGGMSRAEYLAQQERERMSAAFDADARIAELRATVGLDGSPDQCPDIVQVGSEEDVEDQFSYDNPGWSEADKQLAAAKRIRQARARGNIRPAQYLVDDNVLRGPKMRDKYELEAVAEGAFCWKCGDSQPEAKHERAERHRRLRDVFPGYEIPSGLTVDDCCCTCGAILGLRETRVA